MDDTAGMVVYRFSVVGDENGGHELLRIVSVALFAAALLVGEVQAASVTVGGRCSNACSNIGLLDGDAISGVVEIDDNFFVADGSSGNEAITDYAFNFGSFSFSKSQEAYSDSGVSWGSLPGSISSVVISAAASDVEDVGGALLILGAFSDRIGNGFASNNGFMFEDRFGVITTGLFDYAGLVTDPIGSGPAPVPLPAAGWLLLGSLAAAAGLRWSSRRGCAGQASGQT